MSVLDWSETIAAPASSPALARQGLSSFPPVAEARPHLTGTRPAGSVRDYDNLVEALAAYDAAPAGFRGHEIRDLRECAARCGWVGGDEQPLAAWSRRRVASYLEMMGRGVRELVDAVSGDAR